MTFLLSTKGPDLPTSGFSFTDLRRTVLRGDLALAFGILTILAVLILPLPGVILDLFLAISITLSILILMTSLFIQAVPVANSIRLAVNRELGDAAARCWICAN